MPLCFREYDFDSLTFSLPHWSKTSHPKESFRYFSETEQFTICSSAALLRVTDSQGTAYRLTGASLCDSSFTPNPNRDSRNWIVNIDAQSENTYFRVDIAVYRRQILLWLVQIYKKSSLTFIVLLGKTSGIKKALHLHVRLSFIWLPRTGSNRRPND